MYQGWNQLVGFKAIPGRLLKAVQDLNFRSRKGMFFFFPDRTLKCCLDQWIGLREKLQDTPIFNGKNHGFL